MSRLITVNGVPVYGYLVAEGNWVRVRVSADDAERLGLVPGKPVRLEAPGAAGRFLLTDADEQPPLVWLELRRLAAPVMA